MTHREKKSIRGFIAFFLSVVMLFCTIGGSILAYAEPPDGGGENNDATEENLVLDTQPSEGKQDGKEQEGSTDKGGQDNDTGSGTGTGTGSDSGTGTGSGTGTNTNSDTGTNTGSDTGTNTNSDTETNTGTDTETNSGSDSGTGTGSDTETNTNSDTGTSTGSDTETNSGSDSGTDTNSGSGSDTGSEDGTQTDGEDKKYHLDSGLGLSAKFELHAWAPVSQPVLRAWTAQEQQDFSSFGSDHSQEEVLGAFFLGIPGESGDAPLAFPENVRISLEGSLISDCKDELRLYLYNKGQGFYSVLFDKQDRSISFETTELSYFVLTKLTAKEDAKAAEKEETEKEKPGFYVNYNLVEVSASNGNSLLALSELNRVTLQRLGYASTRRSAPTRGGSGEGESTPSWQCPTMSIDNISISWLSPSYNGEVDPVYLDLRSDSNSVVAQAFKIDFTFNGSEYILPGSIEVVIPAYLWLNRDGEEPGYLSLAVPEEPDHGADYVWRREGDHIIITNTRTLLGGTRGIIRGHFEGPTASEMIDGTRSVDYGVTVSYTAQDGSILYRDGNSIYATIDTFAELRSAEKSAKKGAREYYVYYSVPGTSDMPAALRPENPDDYIYVRWTISGAVSGSQPFSLSFSDTPVDEYGCVLLGFSGLAAGYNGGSTILQSTDGQTLSATLFEGYDDATKFAFAWTAYPKANFEEGVAYTVTNNAVITVLEADADPSDPDSYQNRDLPATARIKLPMTYRVTKIWVDDDNAEGHRPSKQDVQLTRDGSYWTTVSMLGSNEWVYSWNDGGQPHSYDAKEASTASGTYYTDTVGVGEDPDYRTIVSWRYSNTNKDYNSETRTWTFTNTYSQEERIVYQVMYGAPEASLSLTKKTYSDKSSDPNPESTADKLINSLRSNANATMEYVVEGKGIVTPYTFTTEPDAARNRQENYNQRPALLDLQDLTVRFGNLDLLPGEYDISQVVLNSPSVKKYWQADKFSNWSLVNVASSEVNAMELKLYGRSYKPDTPDDPNADPEANGWVLYAIKQGSTFTYRASGVSTSGSVVYLPAGVVQVREVAESVYDEVTLSFRVTVRVKPVERVLQYIEDKFDAAALNDDYSYLAIPLQNVSHFEIKDEIYGTTLEKNATSTAYMHGRNYRCAVVMEKSMTHEVDRTNSRVILNTTAKLIQQSNILYLNEYNEAVRDGTIPITQSGTWYDLLPPGVQPDTSTIKIDNYSSSTYVTEAYTVENFMNSGRTLLVIKTNLPSRTLSSTATETKKYHDIDSNYPSTGYRAEHTLTFTAYYAFSEFDIYSLYPDLVNYIAYEADEPALGSMSHWQGETGQNLSAGFSSYSNVTTLSRVDGMEDVLAALDPTNTDHRFVYGKASHNLGIIDTYQTISTSKDVSSDGVHWAIGYIDNTYVNVYEGGIYTYRLKVQSAEETKSSGIIFVDPLENYVPASGDLGYDGNGSWKGTLESVNVEQLVSMGVAPVVWYYTGDSHQLTPDNISLSSLASDAGWSQTMPSNRSDITGVLVDASKDSNGNDFVLEPDTYLAVYIYMRAPLSEGPFENSSDRNDAAQNAHAYNRGFIKAALTKHEITSNIYTELNYTKIGILPYEISVTKLWSDSNDNDRMRPDTITLHLNRNGSEDPVKSVTVEPDGEGNWVGVFRHIPKYDDDYTPITYSISEDPIPGYEFRSLSHTTNDNGEQFRVRNSHSKVLISVPVEKIWTDEDGYTGDREETIQVELWKKTTQDGEWELAGITKPIRENSETGEWKVTFDDLQKFNDGFEIQYKVKEVTELEKYITSYEEIGTNQWQITNRYYPYGDLRITKYVENTTETAYDTEFTFTLILRDNGAEAIGELYSYVKLQNEVKDEHGTVIIPASTIETGDIGTGSSFKLKPNQTLWIKEIKADFTYEVREASKAGFTLKNTGQSGTIRAGKTQYESFTNVYAANGYANLFAEKALVNHELSSYQFRFDLKDENGNLLYTSVDRVAADPHSGDISFPRLHYTEADDKKTFTYTISEQNNHEPGYTYDTQVFTVKVYVEDKGNGTMRTTITYFDANGVQVDHPVFTNVYHASGEIAFRAWKSLKGRALEADEFSFELLGADGSLVQTKENDAEGVIDFDSIHFTEANIGERRLYALREVIGSDNTVVYDESILGIEIEVIDNDDGTLSVEQHFVNIRWDETAGEHGQYVKDESGSDESLPVFYNVCKPGQLVVSKVLAGSYGDADPEFTFHVKFTGEDLDGITLFIVPTSDAP